MKHLILFLSLNCFGMGSINKYCKENPTATICKPTDPVDPPVDPPNPPSDQITDPKYCTSFLFDNNETTTHRLLSDKVSNKDRDAFVKRLVDNRYNTISLQLVSNKEPSVQYDHSKMSFWRTELKRMKVDNKLKVVMWLRSDNAPKWTLKQWKDYIAIAIADLDDLVDVWTTGIENDEYWKEAEVKDLVAFMKSKTKKPIGVHTTPTLHHASYASTADIFMLQTGFGVSAAQVRDQLNGARKLFPTKDIMLAEYSKNGTSKDAEELCAQGLDTKVPIGCMTGCAGRFAVTPPPPPPATGCPAGGSKSNLIKPQSDNDGKLVLVLSCEYLKNTQSVQVGSEKGKDSTNYTTLANGARVHYRFSKAGSSYGNNTIKMTLKNGSNLCYTANMGVRKEGWKFVACGNSNLPEPTTKLYSTTPNSITLREDFFNATGRVDALTNINESSSGSSSVAVVAVRSGFTWTIPNALSSYPRGNLVNTWRIRLTKVPPAGVTYHTSIMQTFVRETEIAANQGKTYPPTTRQ